MRLWTAAPPFCKGRGGGISFPVSIQFKTKIGIPKQVRDDKNDEIVKSRKRLLIVIPAPFCNGVNSSRNPVMSNSYEKTGHRFSPLRRLFTRPSRMGYSFFTVMLNLFQHLFEIDFPASGRHTFHRRPRDGVFRCDLSEMPRSRAAGHLIL